MEQTSFTYDRELEVNGGSNTDRTLAQGPISSFDQGDCVWRDRTLRGHVTGRSGQGDQTLHSVLHTTEPLS